MWGFRKGGAAACVEGCHSVSARPLGGPRLWGLSRPAVLFSDGETEV